MTAVFFVSCSDGKISSGDANTRSVLIRIKTEVGTTGTISPKSFDELTALKIKYSKDPDVNEVYRNALIVRSDWSALAVSIESIPEFDRSTDENKLLAKAYIKLGNNDPAIAILKALTAVGDPEISLLLVHAYFGAGKDQNAAAELDRNWDRIVAQKDLEAINIRGLIYLRDGQFQKAIDAFQIANKIDPKDRATLTSLARSYKAIGDDAKAEEFQQLANHVYDQTENDERNKMQFVDLSRKLERAYATKEFKLVIEITNSMLSITNEKNLAAVHQYRVEAFRALGDKKGEAESLEILSRLKKK